MSITTWGSYSMLPTQGRFTRIVQVVGTSTSTTSMVQEKPLRPTHIQLDWKDRKGPFPIHHVFDGMCVDTIPSLSSAGSSSILFVLLLGAFDTRE